MNEYIAALVDEFYQLGVRHAVFSPGFAFYDDGYAFHGV